MLFALLHLKEDSSLSTSSEQGNFCLVLNIFFYKSEITSIVAIYLNIT